MEAQGTLDLGPIRKPTGFAYIHLHVNRAINCREIIYIQVISSLVYRERVNDL